MKQHRKSRSQQGFTIVELVVVIALLGILAAVALPRFLTVSDDARQAVFEHLEGKLHSVANLVHAQAVLKGAGTDSVNTSDVVIDGLVADLNYGYPQANVSTAGHADIIDLMELTLSGGLTLSTGTGATVRIGYDIADNGCYIQYQEPDASSGSLNGYVITREQTGCDW
ncbi:MAG: type II secretion system protein [Pontibacterium sp.]